MRSESGIFLIGVASYLLLKLQFLNLIGAATFSINFYRKSKTLPTNKNRNLKNKLVINDYKYVTEFAQNLEGKI